jgi:spermidine synthase
MVSNSAFFPWTAAGAASAAERDWPRVALLMGLSGFAGLAYQIVWTQQLGTWLGHEIVAVLAVVTAIFGGLALGAFGLGRRIARTARPGRWYAVLELTIALWALVLVLVVPRAGAWLTQAIGAEPTALRHWSVAFGASFVLLLPATVSMGATLPAMERLLGRLRDQGYAIGGLYACNTAGAVAGTLTAAFLMAPAWGFAATAVTAALTNLLCAALAWRWWGHAQSGVVSEPRSLPAARRPAALWALALSGLLGIGYEVVVVRVLSQIAENTVYTYATLLAVYLLGTAAGAALYQRRATHAGDATWLSVAASASCLAGAGALVAGPTVKVGVLALLGGGFAAALSAEAALALLAFALPTLAMGALFSRLCVEAREAGWRFGDALAANTLGATLAAPLFGVALLPQVGAGALLAVIGLGYLALRPRTARRSWGLWATAATGAALLWAGPSLRFVDVPPGGQVVSQRDGVMAAVSVIEDAEGVRRLHINNREQEGSSATYVADARQAWLPLLLHAAPRRALFLGLGTGVTAASATADPTLRVDAVELLPEVIDAAGLFVPALDGPRSSAAPRLVTADARRYVRAADVRYDVVVADLFHPARSGSGALYTVEHFAAVRERLTSGGLFCQWLPLHQLDLESLRSIVAAYLAVYPQAAALLATHSLDTPVLGLVAWADGGPPDRRQMRARLEVARGSGALDALQLDDGYAVPGSFVADADALRRYARGARVNRDDLPVVAYRAPRLAYGAASAPRERLHALLDAWTVDPARVFGVSDDPEEAAWRRRIAAYWSARNRYLEAGMAVRPAADVQAMLAQVQAPLLDVMRMSPDFRPAYDPLLRMALALGRDDPGAARALLAALQAAQPDRPEAAQALGRMPPPGGPF